MGNGHSSFRTQEGFSLVEVLVALVILAYVALGIAGLFSHAMIVNASGHDYAVLASEARFAMESLQALPFSAAALTDTAGTPASWTPVNPNFTITYTVDEYQVTDWTMVSAGGWPAAAGSGNLKRITMTVNSTNEVLQGRRMLTVTSLKIPG
ncbi:MAG: prepilin-type N-terminal cleavage/methylation domain-containing protein [Thermoanaerobaculales bacterium]